MTADGNALCSTHTLINGATLVNNGTPALAVASLNTAIVALRQQVNQRGIVLGNIPSILLVPSALYSLGVRLLDSALLQGAGNNDINVYRSAYAIKLMTSPQLDLVSGGSDTAWFLLSRNHSVSRLVRQGIETNLRPWQYSNNRTYFYQANFREEVFVPDYVGVWGSTGTT